jgi:ketosteroid isomerase-like protein
MRPLLSALLLVAVGHAAESGITPPSPNVPLFAVRITTGPAWDAAKPANEQAFFREHSANLARLRREGTLVIGARFADTGLVLLRVPDKDAALAAFAPDPSVAAGIFRAEADEFRPFYHGATQAAARSPEIDVVRAQYGAFNAHDADALAALCVENVTWFNVDGDKQSVETQGREKLHEWLVGYFKSVPSVHSEFSDLTQTGPHVSVRERAAWTGKDGQPRAQSALGVFEVRDAKIVRVWYFPAATEPLPERKK